MAHETFRESSVAHALSDALLHVSDLMRKEMRLAKAEMMQKLSSRIQGVVWIGVAGLFGFIALLLVVQSAVIAVSRSGLELHLACLIVAGALAAIGALAFFYGRSALTEDLTPTRTVKQITNDFRTAREKLS